MTSKCELMASAVLVAHVHLKKDIRTRPLTYVKLGLYYNVY